MNKNIKIFFLGLSGLCLLAACKVQKSNDDYTHLVNPKIGSGGHGHVFVGANVPFGAIQVGPTQLPTEWDWCSGYHDSDSTIYGFSQTHLSGTGIGDLGDIVLMPVTENIIPIKGRANDLKSGYFSTFSHQNEIAKPGYYSVLLNRYQVKAELSASQRVAFHQYTYPKQSSMQMVMDLEYGIGWDGPVETHLQLQNDSTISGYRFSKGWADDQKMYFTAVFNHKISKISCFDSTAMQLGNQITAKRAKAIIDFGKTEEGPQMIQVKVGISPVSEANAKANIDAEIKNWNFEETVAKAHDAWNTELSKIKVETLTPAQKTVFYTALFHTMVAPSVFNDVNGDYMGTDKKVHPKADFTNYTTFSLWDTYRAAQPLYTLIHPEKVNDLVKTMLAIYDQQGKLPVWHLMGNETNCMVGNSGVQVVGDAIVKGFKGFDVQKAYDAMKASEKFNYRGISYVNRLQYIPSDKEEEAVAKALEYAIADGSILQVAKKLGKTEDIDYWTKRSQLYHLYFDPNTQFFRGKYANGKWVAPFNPFESKHRANDYTEGTAWQYLWLVPQDVEGLVKLLGGDEKFSNRLDSLFTVSGNMGSEASPDISGLIGQYAHGNEPSHHVAYLYSFVGKPGKTAKLVRQILNTMYTDQVDGLSGNEDVGQMSAWYVLSAMGFYQVNPSNGIYVFGSPIITEATLQLPENKTFHIKVENNSDKNIYIQSITLNGKDYPFSYITYDTIMKGGELVMKMGNTVSSTWGVAQDQRPFSYMK